MTSATMLYTKVRHSWVKNFTLSRGGICALNTQFSDLNAQCKNDSWLTQVLRDWG